MAKTEDTPTRKELITLASKGLLLWSFFAGGCAWNYYYFGRGPGADAATLVAGMFLLPYLIVMSVYIGVFMTKFAKGRWKYPWLWGIGSGLLTIPLTLGLRILFSSVSRFQGYALLFVAPVLSTLLIMVLISIRRKTAL